MTFLLQQLLLEPRRALNLNNEQLNQLISQARSSRLLASLASELQNAGVDVQLPTNVSRHLNSAALVHEKQKRDLAYDCEKIKLALDAIGERLVLLKGAAYMLSDVLAGEGRLVTDIGCAVARWGRARHGRKNIAPSRWWRRRPRRRPAAGRPGAVRTGRCRRRR